MSLTDKVERLRTQLGLEPGLPIVQLITQSVEQLGLADELRGQPLAAQADACLTQLGLPTASEVPMAHIVEAYAVESSPMAYPVQAVPISSTTKSGPCTFKFMIDDWVTSCYYNGQNMMGQVNTGQCKVTTLQVEFVPGAVLCVRGRDSILRHTSGLRCAFLRSLSRGSP